jgi:hypothetical protein
MASTPAPSTAAPSPDPERAHDAEAAHQTKALEKSAEGLPGTETPGTPVARDDTAVASDVYTSEGVYWADLPRRKRVRRKPFDAFLTSKQS